MIAGAGAQDARAVLQAVSKNIGADSLTTLQISGTTGWSSAPGAAHSPADDWPRFELTSYMKQIDFSAAVPARAADTPVGAVSATGRWPGCPRTGHAHARRRAQRQRRMDHRGWRGRAARSGRLHGRRAGRRDAATRRHPDAARLREGGVGAGSESDDGHVAAARPANDLRIDHRARQVSDHGRDQRPERDGARPDACRQSDVRRHVLRDTATAGTSSSGP